MTIRRPALRYYGGKGRIAPWIISHFPKHTCYVEPFGGAASVLLRKPPSEVEVFNDVNGEVVNFFRVLRERPEELKRAIELTPFSREELRLAKFERSSEPLERARQFYVISLQSQRGAPDVSESNAWWYSSKFVQTVYRWNRTDHLLEVAMRLKHVQIECDDAFKVIERYDEVGTLFYCDPPFLFGTRKDTRNVYSHEFSDEDHRRLAEILHSIRGMAVISGSPSPMYEELYRGWKHYDCVDIDMASKDRIERIWISPRAAESCPQRELFEGNRR